MADEQAWCSELFGLIGEKALLRFDANGAWNCVQAESWLKFLSLSAVPIDYVEQPLPVGQEQLMAEMAQAHGVRVALDESIVAYQDLDRWLDLFPKGPFVIKLALLGSLQRLRAWREHHPELQLIYSSAFETFLGMEGGLRLAASDPYCGTALGYGVSHYWENDHWQQHASGPEMDLLKLKGESMQGLWQRL